MDRAPRRCKQPLPALPVDDDIKKISKDDTNVNKRSMSSNTVSQSLTFPRSKRPLPPLPNQDKPPLKEKDSRVNHVQDVSSGLKNTYSHLWVDKKTSIDEDGDYIPMDHEMPTTAGTESNPKATAVCKEEKTSKTPEFEGYSVKETVECFKKCGLDRLAAICEKNTLDGNFMLNVDQDNLKIEPFSLDPLQICKLRMIYKGWRPKHS